MQALNPPKTLNPKFQIHRSRVAAAKSSSGKFSPVSLSAMADRSRQSTPSPLDALINGSRRGELFGAIKRSLPNCLSETDLQLSVPGLKSKTRGKVNPNYTVIENPPFVLIVAFVFAFLALWCLLGLWEWEGLALEKFVTLEKPGQKITFCSAKVGEFVSFFVFLLDILKVTNAIFVA